MLPLLLAAGAAHAHPSGTPHLHPSEPAALAIVATWLVLGAAWAAWAFRAPTPVRG
jgi:hypothetical protein